MTQHIYVCNHCRTVHGNFERGLVRQTSFSYLRGYKPDGSSWNAAYWNCPGCGFTHGSGIYATWSYAIKKVDEPEMRTHYVGGME